MSFESINENNTTKQFNQLNDLIQNNFMEHKRHKVSIFNSYFYVGTNSLE